MLPQPLAQIRPITLEKSFYFTDPVYSDLREIICHERPALFVLHYFFGMKIPYQLFLDRFFFTVNQSGALESCSNLLMTFLCDAKILSPLTCNGTLEDFKALLRSQCSTKSALILPIAHHVAGERLVTSVLVEGFGNDVMVSSLRGDDFYIRKLLPVKDFFASLALEEEAFTGVSLSIPDEITKPDGEEKFFAWIDRYIHDPLDAKYTAFATLKKYQPDHYGSGALKKVLEASLPLLSTYERQVAEGFHNVLLAKILWPMTFCYLPYTIALRETSHISTDGDAIRSLARTLMDQTGLAANMGHLYGKSPKEAMAERFFRSMDQVIATYEKLESRVFGSKGAIP